MAKISHGRTKLVDGDTGEVSKHPGGALSGYCPRAGSMLLETIVPGTGYARRVLINTNCKTWGCLGCRDRLKKLFKLRVETGVSRLKRCAFVTLTYKLESERLEVAGCVARDWAAYLRLLRKESPWIAKMSYLRVMELTKKGTPHHHLVIGTIPEGKKIKCWRGKDFDIEEYQERRATCMCLSHEISRVWFRVTGDSYICHSIPVISARGAAGYMSKYLGKDFEGDRAVALGMQRRWSSSRGWPGSGRQRLEHSEKGEWDRTSWAPGHVGDDIGGGPADLMVRTGDDLDRKISLRETTKRLVRMLERGTHGNANVVAPHVHVKG